MFSLDKLKMSQNVVVPMSLGRAQLHEHVDIMANHLIFELSTYVLADRVDREVVSREIEFTWEEYESWWQHTKATLFPTISRWIRRPPRKVWHQEKRRASWVVDRWVTFPDASIYPPEFGSQVFVQTIEDWEGDSDVE